MAEALSEGVTVEELSGPIYEKFSKSFVAFKEGFVKLQPYNQIVPRCFLNYEKRIKNFQTRPNDVWVASFPKCGNFVISNLITKIVILWGFRMPLKEECELYK